MSSLVFRGNCRTLLLLTVCGFATKIEAGGGFDTTLCNIDSLMLSSSACGWWNVEVARDADNDEICLVAVADMGRVGGTGEGTKSRIGVLACGCIDVSLPLLCGTGVGSTSATWRSLLEPI